MSRRTNMMGSSSTISLGIRSSEGRKRLSISSSSSGSSLKTQIRALLGIEEDFVVKKDDNGRPGDEVKFTRASTISALKLKNGDVLYVTPKAGTRFSSVDEEEAANGGGGTLSSRGSTTSLSSIKSASVSTVSFFNLDEDPVDIELSKQDGMIAQGLTANCNHKSRAAACIYCAPREPYDPEYLRQEGIKFMSFHAYLKKLTREKGKYAALEDIDLKIKPGCGNHAPWPESICSACQPPALTLNRQSYRHVDHIEFENASIVDNFLAYWRTTGSQRVGFLYGKYEPFPKVPLGIKAVVAAIYEPPQECSRDSVKLIELDDCEERVEEIARLLGLCRVGWIFTDLVTDANGKVRHYRNVDSHFLSAQECITAGHYQNRFANVSKQSSNGRHGSKFVTVCVTGSADNQVHMEGYQVSNQCMALVREDVLVPTKDAPELGYVVESSSKKYVPDVFFKEKDKYGNEVTKISRPLPVEYLLIDVPVATPLEPRSTFHVAAKFPIENRPMEGHLQDFAALANYRRDYGPPDLFRDFHLLVYLGTQTVHPLDDELTPLLEAIKEGKTEKIFQWAESSHWHTIEALIQNYNDGYQ